MTSSGTTQTTGVSIKTSHVFFILVWFLTRSRVEIDGQRVAATKAWGETFVPLQPGRHTVYCYAQSILGFGAKAGKSTTTVEVVSGQVVQVNWRAPILYIPFTKGKFSVSAAA